MGSSRWVSKAKHLELCFAHSLPFTSYYEAWFWYHGLGAVDPCSRWSEQTLLSVHPKGSQFWMFIGRTDAEAQTPILWLPDVKNQLIWKDPDAGKDWRREKGTTEDEMIGWHHWLNGHEFEQTPGVGDGQGRLACCSRKELDMTEQLNWTELNWWRHLKLLRSKVYVLFDGYLLIYIYSLHCFPNTWVSWKYYLPISVTLQKSIN